MRWDRDHVSADVEDRRGGGGRRGLALGGGGAAVVIVVVLVAQLLGVDVRGLFGGDGTAPSASDPHADDAEVHFVGFVLDDVQDTFARLFAARGWRYRRAHLVLFTDEVDTGCGRSSAAVGPFYCPPDGKAYIDLSFFRVLRGRLGAGGDFAQAYVLAHELGHHVQALRGADHGDSVRIELQADCYAGVWAHATGQRGLLEGGDIDEAVNAAGQIGDDRLQRMAGRRVNPETFTHGTSAQRARWFRRGVDRGDLDACDTFSAGTR